MDLYALLFAITLASWRALPSQFVHPRIRGASAYGPRIMAALPSGSRFIAGLYLAPLVERIVAVSPGPAHADVRDGGVLFWKRLRREWRGVSSGMERALSFRC